MYKIKPLRSIKKEIIVPPDKSISHRAAIIASIAKGKTQVKPFLVSDDTLATLECIQRLGINANLRSDNSLTIEGNGLFFPVSEKINLYANQSGTTLRILSGILCGQKFPSYFDAHQSLRKRPMNRITQPLRLMGADISGRTTIFEEYPPLEINPVKTLRGIKYKLPVASAQVKSAIIFVSLYAKGKTEIYEPILSRDHTERMLTIFGVNLKRSGKRILCRHSKLFAPRKEIFIPSDFSSAAFFIILGLIAKDTELLIKNVNINPTRCGLLKILKRMGADIKLVNKKEHFEPYADILVKSSALKGVEIDRTEIPLLIDEIPILCVAASFAKGKTTMKGVKELKVKEADRINSLVHNLKQVGVNASAYPVLYKKKEDWQIEIKGGIKNKRADFKSFSDHRTAMSAIILGTSLTEESTIEDIDCINKSFPQFISLIESL
ncbi:MAG: 3-phosphoshikimate 1-carboxyvinyltransferase [Candidatus Omnitrophota bacterium]|nr:3-phosphoshikimate 1-carboxyvinyltransferase [Candidatus Omnitrophota bacterium]